MAKKQWQVAEEEVADIIADYANEVSIVPGSGNQWSARGDIRIVDMDIRSVVSVKSTVRDSISVSKKIIKEIRDISNEQADGEHVLVLHFSEGQEPLAVVPLTDFLEARYAAS